MSKNEFVYMVLESMGEYEPYEVIGVFDADHLESAFELADESDREMRRYNRSLVNKAKIHRHYLNRPKSDLNVDEIERR